MSDYPSDNLVWQVIGRSGWPNRDDISAGELLDAVRWACDWQREKDAVVAWDHFMSECLKRKISPGEPCVASFSCVDAIRSQTQPTREGETP